MSLTKLYYTAPPDVAFDDMHNACIAVWDTMGNDGSYRDEKIAHIKGIANVRDNFMYMFAMFDINNQRKVASLLTQHTKLALCDRMIDGGCDEYYMHDILGV